MDLMEAENLINYYIYHCPCSNCTWRRVMDELSHPYTRED